MDEKLRFLSSSIVKARQLGSSGVPQVMPSCFLPSS